MKKALRKSFLTAFSGQALTYVSSKGPMFCLGHEAMKLTRSREIHGLRVQPASLLRFFPRGQRCLHAASASILSFPIRGQERLEDRL